VDKRGAVLGDFSSRENDKEMTFQFRASLLRSPHGEKSRKQAMILAASFPRFPNFAGFRLLKYFCAFLCRGASDLAARPIIRIVPAGSDLGLQDGSRAIFLLDHLAKGHLVLFSSRRGHSFKPV